MHFNIHDAREVTDITDSNNMPETYPALVITLSTTKPKKKLNYGREARDYKLVLRKAVSYKINRSTKCLLCCCCSVTEV